MKYKLLGVERYFKTYKNSGGGPVAEILLDVPLEILLTIITPKEGDSNIYDNYKLSNKQKN